MGYYVGPMFTLNYWFKSRWSEGFEVVSVSPCPPATNCHDGVFEIAIAILIDLI